VIRLIIDGSTGFGELMHTMRAIHEREGVGVQAPPSGDQYEPKQARGGWI
jgi:hypothetical protein